MRRVNGFISAVYCACIFLMSALNAAEVEGEQSGRWTLAASPYIISEDVTIPGGETLYIEPGVMVFFNKGASLIVRGQIFAKGTPVNQVIFTSVKDITYNYLADKNAPETATNSDWSGIHFQAGVRVEESIVENVTIRFCETPLSVEGAQPVLSKIIISECAANTVLINGNNLPVHPDSPQDFPTTPQLASDEKNGVGDADANTANTAISDASRKPSIDETLSGSDVSFSEIEVVSATRMLQNIIQAPATITAIQEDDISNFGEYHFANLLRYTPGIDVFATHNSNINVNPRGYNRLNSNRTLVLIDNRIVNTTLFGTVLWNTFPIGLQDIQNAEVLRGPTGSLYGANAVGGVINITTKNPRFWPGVHIRSFMGVDNGAFVTELNYSGSKADWAYSISASGTNLSALEHHEGEVMSNQRGRLYLERNYATDKTLSFDVGTGKSNEDQFLPWGPYAMPVEVTPEIRYGKVNYRFKNLNIQSYYNAIDFEANGIGIPFSVDMDNSLLHNSAEIQGDGEYHKLVAGIAHRRDAFTGNVTLNKEKSINQYSIYLQDDMRLTNKLSFVVGIRIDWKPKTTTEFPLKAAMVYSPTPEHSFRASASQGFRSPTLFEYFVRSQFENASVLGSIDLVPELAEVCELGYRGLWNNDKLMLGIDLFRESISDFIMFSSVDSSTITYANGSFSTNIGGEIELGMLLSEKWKIQGAVSYQKIKDKDQFLGFEDAAPRFKYSFGISRNPAKGFFLNWWSHYSDRTTWSIATPGQPVGPSVTPRYLMSNFYGGYSVNTNLRYGVSIANITDEEVNQFPLGVRDGLRVSFALEVSF